MSLRIIRKDIVISYYGDLIVYISLGIVFFFAITFLSLASISSNLNKQIRTQITQLQNLTHFPFHKKVLAKKRPTAKTTLFKLQIEIKFFYRLEGFIVNPLMVTVVFIQVKYYQLFRSNCLQSRHRFVVDELKKICNLEFPAVICFYFYERFLEEWTEWNA